MNNPRDPYSLMWNIPYQPYNQIGTGVVVTPTGHISLARVRADRPLAPAEAQRLVAHILSAVEESWRRGPLGDIPVGHRDLVPYVDTRGQVACGADMTRDGQPAVCGRGPIHGPTVQHLAADHHCPLHRVVFDSDHEFHVHQITSHRDGV